MADPKGLLTPFLHLLGPHRAWMVLGLLLACHPGRRQAALAVRLVLVPAAGGRAVGPGPCRWDYDPPVQA